MTTIQLSTLPHPATNRRLLRNDIYETLVECILNGSLTPGYRLRDAELTQWLRVSRTPIREALARLMVVGLIHTEPNRYTIVAPLNVSEVREAIEVLQLLLPHALRSSNFSAPEKIRYQTTVILGTLEQEDSRDSMIAFEQILTLVISGLDNPVLREAIDTAYLRFVRYFRLNPSPDPVLTRERVIALASALRDGDAADEIGEILESALDALGSERLQSDEREWIS